MAAKGPARASLRYAKAPLSPRYQWELHQLLGHCWNSLCIPRQTGRQDEDSVLKKRKTPVKYDKRRYKRRNRIEIMFGRLKDWRRDATRYDRCPKVFLSAIALAALVIYWL